ncbi:unnamed protein product [Owenia fusiformis]|uniref:Amine oxidase domain-containing protein n=1 Tax=Owenia fusiformis TaxID=6347 RepID=A0A8S4NR57_OWEFU|nr:unnamed protein product [Owenia fusiformis]
MEKEPHDLVLNVCHELMEKFLKRSIQRPINLIRTNWASEPYVYGSYSYQSTHGKHSDVDILAAPLPNEKVPRLMFAGEATSKHYFSTVHGAMMSGWREADRLAQLYTSHD